MAVYKTIKGVSKHPSGLKNILTYVGKETKYERVFKTTGLHISSNPERAFKDMCMTKDIFKNTNGRQYRHHIQSFKPDEVTPELVHQIGVEFCKRNFPDFDVYIATHIDKNHIHNHFIINTVSNRNGKKINEITTKQYNEKRGNLKNNEIYLESLKEESDILCKKYNLSVIGRKKGKSKSLNIYNQKEYHIVKKHLEGKEKSFKVELALLIKKLIFQSYSKENFIEKMKDRGIEVEWVDSKKNIVFKFFNNNILRKIRLSNLYKTFNQDNLFTKEGLENAIRSVSKRKKERDRLEKEMFGDGKGIERSPKNRRYSSRYNKITGKDSKKDIQRPNNTSISRDRRNDKHKNCRYDYDNTKDRILNEIYDSNPQSNDERIRSFFFKRSPKKVIRNRQKSTAKNNRTER